MNQGIKLMLKKFYWFVKCMIGLGSIRDGSICWFSKKFWEVHDYHKDQGGHGQPWHFHVYKCPKCGKEFII